jgi:cation diffusion facilitator family transporter
MITAGIGLAVNLLSALLLGSGEHHTHVHPGHELHRDHDHDHTDHNESEHPDHSDHQHYHFQSHSDHAEHSGTDHNLRAAYMHVMADALTSVMAIAALLAGKYLGWNWLDPLTGFIGAVVIFRWSISLLKGTVPILVDGSADKSVMDEVKSRIESYKESKVVDLHMWRVSASHYSLQMSIVTHQPEPVENYYKLLDDLKNIDHLSIEIFRCNDPECIKAGSYHV